MADPSNAASGADVRGRPARGPVALRVTLGLAVGAVLLAAVVEGSQQAPIATPATAPPGRPVAPGAAPRADSTPSGARVAPLTRVGAAHVLVAYRGAERAGAEVARTKDQARALADSLAAQLHAHPEKWNSVVNEVSDDAATKPSRGDIGNIERYAMPDAFSTVAFSLNVGEVSGVVETPLGFHVIRRVR